MITHYPATSCWVAVPDLNWVLGVHSIYGTISWPYSEDCWKDLPSPPVKTPRPYHHIFAWSQRAIEDLLTDGGVSQAELGKQSV